MPSSKGPRLWNVLYNVFIKLMYPKLSDDGLPGIHEGFDITGRSVYLCKVCTCISGLQAIGFHVVGVDTKLVCGFKTMDYP